MTIALHAITKRFGGVLAVDQVSLAIPQGQLVALLGPSGSGKTTLLRLIAGLEAPDAGHVHLGAPATAAKGAAPRVGFVFQHYALFPHMTVARNIAFGLTCRPRRQRPAATAIRARVAELLELIQLPGHGDRYPDQLSGGQRQRVALARALAIDPQVLLLDEPFGALDARVRAELRGWLRELHARTGLTTVFVTHDQAEAFELADRVVVLQQGRIAQEGTPQAVYDAPASPFVFTFVGETVRLPAVVHRGEARIGSCVLPAPAFATAEPTPAMAYLRPHQLAVTPLPARGPAWTGVVRSVQAVGPLVRVEVDLAELGCRVQAHLAPGQLDWPGLEPGQPVQVTARHARVFAAA